MPITQISIDGDVVKVHSFTDGVTIVKRPSHHDRIRKEGWDYVQWLLNRASYLESQKDVKGANEAFELAIDAERILKSKRSKIA